jgi:N utilization substance protein B
MKTARRYARELAMQGIFQWQFNHDLTSLLIEEYLRENRQFLKADEALLSNILQGVLANTQALFAKIIPYYDCQESEVKPIERAILLISTYELLYHPDTPSAVILNEAIEIAKIFGGTDGYKFINAVLDKLALDIRKP